MKKRAIYWIVPVSVLTLLVFYQVVLRRHVPVDFENASVANRPPRIQPDYSDTVLPPNIAPPNFLIREPGEEFGVRIRSAGDQVIHIVSRTPRISIPMSQWQRLLSTNRGRSLYFDVCVRRADGQWTRFEPIVNAIADADIDRYLFYRIMRPIYIVRVNLAIEQRDLQTYEESVVLNNRSFQGGCINCHSFAPNHHDRMIVHFRGDANVPPLSGMIVAGKDGAVKVDTRALISTPESERGRITKSQAAYTAWHPNGRVAAYSANEISQFFHAVGENRDVLDTDSDLALYHFDSNTVTTTPNISTPDRLETFPAWSPDGRFLYFCSCDPFPIERYMDVRYDLMRISYDPDTGRWGEVEPVLLAEDTGLSITEPRVSPDGRWLLFCMSAYGSFPVYQPSSDLYLLDLKTRQHRRLDINSPKSESWHSWSSNSRWIAFASKRRDGLFGRIYFSYVDESGQVHKPWVLPQKDPTFYDRCIETYNVPELASRPAPASARSLARAIRSPSPTGDAKLDSTSSMRGQDVP